MFDSASHGFPPVDVADPDLERRLLTTPPGAALAELLEGIDRADLGEADRVVVMQARARLLAHVQGELYADMVCVGDAVADAIGGHELEFEADEIRAPLVLTRRAAENQMSVARALVERFPNLWQALSSGLLDAARVHVIIEGVAGLSPDAATRLIDNLLPDAPSLTTGQLRARITKMVIAVNPDAAASRYEEGVKCRRVWTQPNPDGTAALYGLDLPADRVAAAINHIHQLARQAKTANDSRTADQVRADLFLDLLCGEASGNGGQRAVVDLRVDLTTLAGLDQNPAEIPGSGPVIADVARKVAQSQSKARWQVTVTGNEGEVVWTGTTRRRPDAAMRRYLETSRPTCVFPGCRIPARRSDIDHNRAWSEGGPTHPDNLSPLCRHDHLLKHEAGWAVEQTRPGIWTWTSPLGRKYQVVTAPP